MSNQITRYRIAAASFFVLIWLLLSASPVLAHEFRLGILLTASAEEPAEQAFLAGFRLAVDQSPDVSHPPGEDAGDHLGGVDVAIIAVENVGGPDAARQAVLDLIEEGGVAVVVADLPTAALEAIFDPIAESNTLLLATSGITDAAFPASPLFFAMNAPGTPEIMEDFTKAFREAYGREPSEAAVRGYLAARLIDDAVAATDGEFSNEQAFYDGMLTASRSLLAPVPAPKQTELPIPLAFPSPSCLGR